MLKHDGTKIKNYSPLRYPGGKGRLYPFLASIIRKTNKDIVYIEPFAGGAGLALSLLLNGDVNEIVINDYDKTIYSFWKAILTQTNEFLDMLESVPITTDEWELQREVFLKHNKKYSLELGFATFFLNRVNRSGILNAGLIGGYNQDGNYKMDVRFNKIDLAERIKIISSFRKRIHLYNHDIRAFVKYYLPKYQDNAFIYFDPPYFKKGKQLYQNFFIKKDHQEIFTMIDKLSCPWIVTYDNADEIKAIYKKYKCWYFDLMYGVANSGINSELLFISDEHLLPHLDEKQSKKINFRLSC